ncbi:endonuclease/exonuclease/phosphatase family protein [Sulfurimonas sp. SAG-AH-194-L11]|nr:endonuclease/exonuclease/phosphatase family protein [Sulfurimonas sp. SAG-AH-194-L11]
MKIFVIFLLLLSVLQGAQTLKIATYNVENLFDLQKSGHEYTEYIPNSYSQWNKKNYTIKLRNIAKVIYEINADIIALQEIESEQALKDLRYELKRKGLYYKYYKIANYKQTTIKVALLSKIPFVYTHEIAVKASYRYRNILEAKFKINNQELFILVNHWKSKSGPESMRIVSAKKVLKRTEELGLDKNIIVLGDFNSHYEEDILFKRKRKHNDTNGVTGINHILGTKEHTNKSTLTDLDEGEYYNLWYDINTKDRYSYIYRGKKEALDNILVSPSLLKTQGVHYKTDSIHTYKKKYLLSGKSINRWKMSRKKPRVHKGKGYSDHLAVIAEFVVN